MSDLFGYLEKSENERDDRLSGSRAKLIAKQRVQKRFASYIDKASDDAERKARIQYLADDIVDTVKKACKEHDYANHREVIAEVLESLKTACGCGCEGGEPCTCNEEEKEEGEEKKESSVKVSRNCPKCGSDETYYSDEGAAGRDNPESMECEDCGNKWKPSKEEYEKEEDEKSKTAAIDEPMLGQRVSLGGGDAGEIIDILDDGMVKVKVDGSDETRKEHASNLNREASRVADHQKTAEPVAVDGYQQETVDLGASKDGTDGNPSPKMDSKQVPDDGLDVIDVKSVRHPLENQSVTDKPDYTDLRHDGPEVADPTDDTVRHRVNADDPIQPEFNKGPHTDTWSGEGGQANPVTSSVESKWFV